VPVWRARALKRQRDQLEALVRERTAELARHSSHLEEIVQERTQQLGDTYQQLLTREAERNRIAEALAAASGQATLGRMAGIVAHQVNTPLAAIKARLSLLREDLLGQEGAHSSLSAIDRQVDRIARTVRVLLGFVRQRELGGQNPCISVVVQPVVDLYAEALKTQGAELRVSLPTLPLRVQGSLDDLQELLMNLVENARQAVPSGGQIRIAAESQGDWLRLVVEDNGMGLGDDAEHLFQPFFTTKPSGTGLGLAIARRIAQAHGGSLHAEARRDGPGARFVLSLKVAPSAASE
jgi:signal transduction histidine kinase